MDNKLLRTFMSANSPKGFYSLYPEFLKDKKTYIIKGGPGTGKSSLMKKIATNAYRSGYFVEYVYCSSDPQSLDGVYIPALNTVVCDGTAPHTADPAYAGSEGGIVNVGECWDEKKLIEAKDDIRAFSRQIGDLYDRAYKYLACAGNAYDDIKNVAKKYLNTEKLNRFTQAFISERLPEKSGDGKLLKRFLSSFSPEGFITFRDTVYSAETVFAFSDKFALMSGFMQAFASAAAQHYEVYVFYNPLCPAEIAHVLVPELDIALVTADKLTAFEPQNTKKISLSRFLKDGITDEKNKLTFARTLLGVCTDEATACITRAKQLHDDMEEIYIAAMNFEKVERITAALMTKIFL